jgi:hypothetical protein
MNFLNISGEPIDMSALRAKAPAHRALLGPDSKKRKPTPPNGYAAPPGTGPEGKTCRDCTHKHTMSNTGAKSWIKCDLRRATWTHGPGSDIRASSPACAKFVPKSAALPPSAPPTQAQKDQ